MSEQDTYNHLFKVFIFSFLLLIITGDNNVCGDSLETDKKVLLSLKTFLEGQNHVNRGSKYRQWNSTDSSSPCEWPGISCENTGNRVTGIDFSDDHLAGKMFDNFSALTALERLDLSMNTIEDSIPGDLGMSRSLRFLNLSHNMISGELNLTGLSSLEVLDLSLNRIQGEIQGAFPGICNELLVVSISNNRFTGEIGNRFVRCRSLRFLDLSTNELTGGLSFGFDELIEFSVSHNDITGNLSSWIFTRNCRLQALDLSENGLSGELPKEISNCNNLRVLNLWGNHFSGPIPGELGSIQSLETLYLGNNEFSSNIPGSLSGLTNLNLLDLSQNNFGGEIQEIFGRFTQLKSLLLNRNAYTGGIVSSGIHRLANLSRLDLSENSFSGLLPVEISQMTNLKFLILALNRFTGTIPSEYGNLPQIQAIDLSFNELTGSIPTSFGRLTSLLWLNLESNSLTGEIPRELGNCSSLLWLNLANNRLSGSIPPELSNIGSNPTPTFLSNRIRDEVTPGSPGECSSMKRWVPADYPPFVFVYPLLTGKNCKTLWDKLLNGYGLFQFCVPGTNIRTFQISGYLQLCDNELSGPVPTDLGKMHSFSMLHLGENHFQGKLPPEIGEMPLVVLNVTRNEFSGEIPTQIGDMKCLLNLDFSHNNFSGEFPTSLNNLTDLNKFNISYNPYIYGVIPPVGQLATFEKWSFLGDPLLHLPSFIDNSTDKQPGNEEKKTRNQWKVGTILVFSALVLAIVVFGVIAIVICLVVKEKVDYPPGYLLEYTKRYGHGLDSCSGSSSPWLSTTNNVNIIRLDHKTLFTHSDILNATGNFSEDRIVGRGGFGTVYHGVLPDGREIAVKKLQREGEEGEREFRAEMEALSGNGCFEWPHPNLVTLYGWCLNGSEKLLVYEYMEGGSLDDLITDRVNFSWRRRIKVAVDVAKALVFLHHQCHPCIVHRDVKASNVLLDREGRARVTDFGLARFLDSSKTHVTTKMAGTVGYVAPEYWQTWRATTRGDVYSYGVLAMELATARRAVDGGEECLLEWARRVMGGATDVAAAAGAAVTPVAVLVSGLADGAAEMCELLRIGVRCTDERPHVRPNMKQVLDMLTKIRPGSSRYEYSYHHGFFPPSY